MFLKQVESVFFASIISLAPISLQIPTSGGAYFPALCGTKQIADLDSPQNDEWMRCFPDTLHFGDTLIIKFQQIPHEGQLGILDPERRYFAIADDADTTLDNRPMIPSDLFRTMEEVILSTSTTRLFPYVYGAKRAELVFSRKGWYTIVFGETLATDDPSKKIYKRRVYYLGRHKNK